MARGALPPRAGNNFAGSLAGAANAPRAVGRGGGGGGTRPMNGSGMNGMSRGVNQGGRGVNQAGGRGLQRPTKAAMGLGNTISFGGDSSNAVSGNRRGGTNTFCKGCNIGLVPTIDDYYKADGEGPYCRNCWADCWVPHQMYSLSNMPMCKFGYRWTDRQMLQIQGLIKATLDEFHTKAGRQPSALELDHVLSQMKVSEACPFCKTDVAFSPKTEDFKISGVNA